MQNEENYQFTIKMEFHEGTFTLFAKMILMHTSATSVELLMEGILDGSFPA
jgi:hypothetical protein